jgi:hypothetical protein
MLANRWGERRFGGMAFALCSLEDSSLSLGFGFPWSRRWLKRWQLDYSAITRVVVSGYRMYIREDEKTYGVVNATMPSISEIEKRLTSHGVTVEHSSIPRVAFRRFARLHD